MRRVVGVRTILHTILKRIANSEQRVSAAKKNRGSEGNVRRRMQLFEDIRGMSKYRELKNEVKNRKT